VLSVRISESLTKYDSCTYVLSVLLVAVQARENGRARLKIVDGHESSGSGPRRMFALTDDEDETPNRRKGFNIERNHKDGLIIHHKFGPKPTPEK
jgi:hypothetical protein